MNDLQRPLLILDLDETLIHGSDVRLHRDADFKVGPFHIYKRPFVEEFFASTREHFDFAIWSSASWDYVDEIANELVTLVPEWQFVWNRFRCVQRMHPEYLNYYYIKDLKKVKRLGYDLARVLIVDDTQLKASRNYGNAVYVYPFEGDDGDTELLKLAPYLNSIRFEHNFRSIEKRGWRTKTFEE